MKKLWNSVFQTVSQSVKTLNESVNKRMRHDVVLMTTGISVVTMLTFSAGDLGGNGGNAMVAFAETQVHVAEAEAVLETAEENSLLLETEIETVYTEESESEGTVVSEETVGQAESEDAELNVTEESVEPETEVNVEETEEDVEVVLSPEEYNVLLRIVQAEAGNCDEKGKLLVANVILNRVESKEFPDTVYGVVYQKKQFSPVMNGTINTCKVTMETRSAVDRALKGEDPSDGALYFMNRGKSSSRNVRWFDTNLEYLFQHGAHEFFR